MLQDEAKLLKSLEPYITDKRAVAGLIRAYRRDVVRGVLWNESARIVDVVDRAKTERLDMLINQEDWYKKYLIEVGEITRHE